MLKYALMILTCLVVGGAMTGILLWFLRRLKRIEDDFWGKQKEQHK
jgi:multisubunit Na+/H+ antiporter MnhC subunit